MRIRILVDKVAALKAGKDEHGRLVVDVPASSLSAEQREEPIRYDSRHRDLSGSSTDFSLDLGIDAPVAAEATQEAVLSILDKLIQRKVEAERRKARDHEEEVQRWLDRPVEEWVSSDGYWLDRVPNDPRLDNHKGFARRLLEEQRAATALVRAREEAEKCEERARREAGVKLLRTWAMECGGELLRARVADGYEWLGLACQEFANASVADLGLKDANEIPDGYDRFSELERTTPTLEEIKLIRSIQERLPEHISGKLIWAKYTCDDSDETLGRCEIRLRIMCPDGSVEDRFFAI
jgi:hypothetical protein